MGEVDRNEDMVVDGRAERTARERREARWRWLAGTVVALVFHAGIILLLRVDLGAHSRVDRANPRVTWVGDRTLLEEGTLQGQVMDIFDDTPLFLPTTRNFAGVRRTIEDTRAPGEIFARYDPIPLVPTDGSLPGLFSTPEPFDSPAVEVSRFRWPYFTAFRRDDSMDRAVETRLARIEVRSFETSALVFATTVPESPIDGANAGWPDWEPFDLFFTVSETGRMSEPVTFGRSSRSEAVDQYMRDILRSRLRLDLILGPGQYRVLIGP